MNFRVAVLATRCVIHAAQIFACCTANILKYQPSPSVFTHWHFLKSLEPTTADFRPSTAASACCSTCACWTAWRTPCGALLKMRWLLTRLISSAHWQHWRSRNLPMQLRATSCTQCVLCNRMPRHVAGFRFRNRKCQLLGVKWDAAAGRMVATVKDVGTGQVLDSHSCSCCCCDAV